MRVLTPTFEEPVLRLFKIIFALALPAVLGIEYTAAQSQTSLAPFLPGEDK